MIPFTKANSKPREFESGSEIKKRFIPVRKTIT